MVRPAFTYLSCICIAIGALVAAVEARGVQQSYLIKPRDVSDRVEALGILRRFIPKSSPLQDKCEKYAVTLSLLNKNGLDQFKLAEIGLSEPERVGPRFREIDIETLVQLYIEGIDEFRSKHIDASLFDLYDCLSTNFKAHNRKAKRLLNDPELQAIVNQYKLLASSPLTLLTDPQAKPLDITRDAIMPSIKKTLLDLFNGDEAKLNSRLRSEDLVVAEAVGQANVMPVVGQADAFVGQSVQTGAYAQSMSVDPDESETSADLTEDEALYLLRVIESLHSLYNQLPDLALNDRCRAYGQVIEAEDVNDQMIADVVGSFKQKATASTQSGNDVYVPEKDVRDNFLFVLSSFGKDDIGVGTWVDMIDCISQWEKIDPDVESYMNDEEQAKIFEELMAASEAEAANSEQSAATAQASASAQTTSS